MSESKTTTAPDPAPQKTATSAGAAQTRVAAGSKPAPEVRLQKVRDELTGETQEVKVKILRGGKRRLKAD